MAETIKHVRRRYAEHVAALARTDWTELIQAFANVPRERFVGPGPWTIIGGDMQRETTPDADPRRLYRNVLVGLDDSKSLNNGQPQFWAMMYARLRPQPGERAIHVGAGGGYYTAILADLVEWNGWVTGIEYEPNLADGARRNLADRPNVEILAGDAHTMVEGTCDIVVASCGFDEVPVAWVRLLNDGGRMLIPLTGVSSMPGIGAGAMLLVTRRGATFDAEFVSGTMIYHAQDGRSEDAGRRLSDAFAFQANRPWTPPKVAALHLDGVPDDTCWLAGVGWWLSMAR